MSSFLFKTPAVRRMVLIAVAFSIFINVLYLLSPLFMIQIYDRVLPSQSLTTLVSLTVGLAIALAIQATLDAFRSITLARVSVLIDAQLQSGVVERMVELRAIPGSKITLEPLSDVEKVQHAVSGGAFSAVFDLPWFPIYILVLFILHPAFAGLTLLTALLLFGAMVGQYFATRQFVATTRHYHAEYFSSVSAAFERAEVVAAMGMMPALMNYAAKQRTQLYRTVVVNARRGALFSSLGKYIRYCGQSLMLALAAYLVIEHGLNASSMFPALTLLSRALAPMELLLSSWKLLAEARVSIRKLDQLLDPEQKRPSLHVVGVEKPRLEVNDVSLRLSADTPPVLRNISLSVPPGSVLAIIGPSGSGKSSLARLITGVWRPSVGTVRLDGSDVYLWDRENFGRVVGYLPQDVALFPGTVANNISRFEEADPDDVIEAARRAGVHELVASLPNGYDTMLGYDGIQLSGGQRQRVGFARALYRRPKLIVLDEPNAHLDAQGEEALTRAIEAARERGATVVLIAHQKRMLLVSDYVALLNRGMLQFFLKRDEAIAALNRPLPEPVPPVLSAPVPSRA